MRYTLRLDNISISPFDQAQLDRKMQTLQKHLHPPYIVDISIAHRDHHLNGDETVNCIVNIEQGKTVFHADRSGSDVQSALDQTLQAMDRELRRAHEKQKMHRV